MNSTPPSSTADKAVKSLSSCSPDELRERGFKLMKRRTYANAPLAEQLQTKGTVAEVGKLMMEIRACPSISSRTVRKCEKAALDRIGEILRANSEFAGQMMESAAA